MTICRRGPLVLIDAATIERLLQRAPCEYDERKDGCGRESAALAAVDGSSIVVCSDHAERLQAEEVELPPGAGRAF